MAKDFILFCVLPYMKPSAETHLIEAAQSGDRDAFSRLLEQYYDAMYGMAYKWCGNADSAQDIVQEACIKISRQLGSFRFQASFSSWLYRIVINAAKDYVRKQKPAEALDASQSALHHANTPETQLQHQQMLACIGQLPEKERTALLLVFGEGLNHRDAAFTMQCRESTVSWYIHKARKHLKQLIPGVLNNE